MRSAIAVPIIPENECTTSTGRAISSAFVARLKGAGISVTENDETFAQCTLFRKRGAVPVSGRGEGFGRCVHSRNSSAMKARIHLFAWSWWNRSCQCCLIANAGSSIGGGSALTAAIRMSICATRSGTVATRSV